MLWRPNKKVLLLLSIMVLHPSSGAFTSTTAAATTPVTDGPNDDNNTYETRKNDATRVVETFQQLLDAKSFDQAAALVADDAEIKTPFGMKTKQQFLRTLEQTKNGGPVWEAPPQNGAHECQCIEHGTRQIAFLQLKLQRIIEINKDSHKISKITVTKR
jgi:hypothetical protein